MSFKNLFSVNNEDATNILLNQQALMSAGERNSDFSMEETWNFIAATADLRKSFGRTCAILALLKGRENGHKEPH